MPVWLAGHSLGTGVAVSGRQVTTDAVSVAVPVRDRDGVVAAVSVVMHVDGPLSVAAFALEPLAERLLFFVDDLAAGDRKLGVRGNPDLHVRQRHAFELGLEFIGIVTEDFVVATNL